MDQLAHGERDALQEHIANLRKNLEKKQEFQVLILTSMKLPSQNCTLGKPGPAVIHARNIWRYIERKVL